MATRWRCSLFLLGLLVMHPALADDNGPVPAYPAALTCDSGNCSDVLHSDESMTFVTRVPFPLGSARLTKQAQFELMQMLIELESFSVVQGFDIVGNTDASGPEPFNMWLSKKRAERVMDYFSSVGVDPRTVTIDGVGSSQPIAGATDPAENRRVDIRITVKPFLK